MTSPTQKKDKRIEQQLHNATIVRVTFDRETREARKHLRLDFEDGGTVLITGKFSVLYNEPAE